MADFETCVQYVLYQEDSHHNPGIIVNEHDGGGLTRLGVTQKYHGMDVPPTFFSSMPFDQAVIAAKEVFRKYFWNPIHGDQIPFDNVAAVMLSFAVNDSPQAAIKTLQKVLDVTEDGVIGPVTILTLQGKDPLIVEKLYRAAWADFYHYLGNVNPSKAQFVNGWVARTELAFPNPVQPTIYV
jgi:lysozyme family protein